MTTCGVKAIIGLGLPRRVSRPLSSCRLPHRLRSLLRNDGPSDRPEIMSPAGYWPRLRDAVEAGADAVYFGLKHFTARAKVGFTLAELTDVMQLLHTRGVRGYLTFNTLIFDHEFR